MKGLEELEKIGNIILDKIQDENYGEICFRVKHLFSQSYSIIEKELKASSKLKSIIEDTIKKINKRIDKMDKQREKNFVNIPNEDFKEEYNFHKAQLSAFYFVLSKMEVLETMEELKR